jgi:gluconate 2-dehydrogenase gamma chain
LTSRRQLFRSLGAATVAVVALPAFGARAPGTAQGMNYAPNFFTPHEWTFVNAACARLIPNDSLGPGAAEAGVPEYIDRQMATPWATGALWYMQGPFSADAPATLGYQSQLNPQQIYRLGIAAADAFARKTQGESFAQLAPDDQDTALHAMESGEAQFETVPAKLFFSMLLQSVREGFFADPVHGGNRGLVGWKLIGFPGARADFMDWVNRDVKYPLPPVALTGQRG